MLCCYTTSAMVNYLVYIISYSFFSIWGEKGKLAKHSCIYLNHFNLDTTYIL